MSVGGEVEEGLFPLDEAVARRVISEGVPVVLSRQAGSVLAIKEGDLFFVSGIDGNVEEEGVFGLGLFHRDTRFLSRFTLRLCGARPILLSSSADRGYLSQIDLTNTDVWEDDEVVIPQQTVNVRRVRVVDGLLHERIRVKNHGSEPVEITIELGFEVDFADVLEVRGLRRTTRGTMLEPKLDGRGVTFAYLGRDDLFRQTRIRFSEAPESSQVWGNEVRFTVRMPLRPKQTRLLGVTVEPVVGEQRSTGGDLDGATHRLRASYREWDEECVRISTDSERFDALLARGRRDLRTLLLPTPQGDIVSGGIPWYVAPFGRDMLVTAYEMLAVDPRIARDTLRFAAHHQGEKVDPWRDEEPGKILHELRRGELAVAGFVPHTPYYGSVDATPLFCMLAAAYFRWTADRELIDALLPALRAAIRWMDEYGDVDGDGFVEYERRSPRGLENQGWRDSVGAVVHTDGTHARPPIALAEVQGYVYMAKVRMAEILALLGYADESERLHKDATLLRERFDEAFWDPEEGYYALALDGEKRPVRTVASNPGHGLYCGIVEPERADAVVRRLFQPDMFSGWGIRTVSKGSASFNPMSHHNGSVWPHDNAVIAAGLKRYGYHSETLRLVTAMVDAAAATDSLRLPELYCGFTRRKPNRPVSYPVACSPHAVSAGSVLLFLQAMLGISARAHEDLLTVNIPMLPPWLRTVEIRDLRVGDSRISMRFTREGEMTSFAVLDRTGDVRVVMEE